MQSGQQKTILDLFLLGFIVLPGCLEDGVLEMLQKQETPTFREKTIENISLLHVFLHPQLGYLDSLFIILLLGIPSEKGKSGSHHSQPLLIPDDAAFKARTTPFFVPAYPTWCMDGLQQVVRMESQVEHNIVLAS